MNGALATSDSIGSSCPTATNDPISSNDWIASNDPIGSGDLAPQMTQPA